MDALARGFRSQNFLRERRFFRDFAIDLAQTVSRLKKVRENPGAPKNGGRELGALT